MKSSTVAMRVMDYAGISLTASYLSALTQRDAVFIWIPKNAGTSLQKMLSASKLKSLHHIRYRFPNKGTVTFGHMDYASLRSNGYISTKFDKSAYKFAVSRNPYDRAISLYHYICAKKTPNCSFLNFWRHVEKQKLPTVGLYNVDGLSQCNPQVRWVENIDIDYIGKMETLDHSLKVITDRLGLRTKALPKLNRSARSAVPSYYCKESKEIIENLYSDDFKAFGYQFLKSI